MLFLCIFLYPFYRGRNSRIKNGCKSSSGYSELWTGRNRNSITRCSNPYVKASFPLKTLRWCTPTSVTYIHRQSVGFCVRCCVLLKSGNSLCIKFIMRLKATVLRKRRVENVLQKPFCLIILMLMLLSQNLAEAGAKIYIGLILSGLVNKCVQIPKELKGT